MTGALSLDFPQGVDMASSKWLLGFAATVGFSILAGCGAVFVNEGSKNASLAQGLQNPDANQPKVSVPADQKKVSDFEDGSTSVNPKLFGAHGGGWMAYSFAGNSTNGTFVVPGGANGDKMSAHVYGTLTDKGDGSYPSFTLQCNFNGNGPYDASPYDGIKFYYKCPAADQDLKRRFGIGTSPTLANSEGGTCSNNCDNHFGVMLSSANDWVVYTLKFTDLTREQGWGAPVTPPDLVDHLKEFVCVKWDHGANNAAGSYTIDYWVDDVEFF